MFDIHPPHGPIHGWRDILRQLFVVTLGLLIALSLEGGVEWLHHRHVMHEAEASLDAEIKSNALGVQSALDSLHRQQATLKKDVEVLKTMIANPDPNMHAGVDVGFSIKTFDDVSWKTAQATGAISYMPYELAQQYSEMYSRQDDLAALEQQAARDTTLALAPLMNLGTVQPSTEQATTVKDHIEVLQGQLLLVDAYLEAMDRLYKKFLSRPS